MRRLILGTRGSPLALWQARHVAARLSEVHPGLEIEERIVRTEGDRTSTPIVGFDERGVFVKALEERLLDGRIDVAVHSMKDLPSSEPEGLVIAAVPERHDPCDALLTRDGVGLDELPEGATLATGSPRRRCQLLTVRPDLSIIPVRGNVDTRVRKLVEGQFDGLILARAGVERLGIDAVPFVPLSREVCLPAVGQGALAIEVRDADTEARELLAPLIHPPTRTAVSAERSFLRRLGGGCLAPATAHARVDGERIRIKAVVGGVDGQALLTGEREGATAEGDALGADLAVELIERGAIEMLDAARRAAEGQAAP
jgi:hydroxymethylbilane synthase